MNIGLQPMADPAGLSAAVLVAKLCGPCIPARNSRHYTKSAERLFAEVQVILNFP